MREAQMSANLIYVTANTERSEAFKAICADENYTLTVCTPESIGDCSTYDLIFCDVENSINFSAAPKTIPIVAIYDAANPQQVIAALTGHAIDVLAFPFNAIEAASRLRCLSRLHMLQDELNHRRSIPKVEAALPVLVVGSDAACKGVEGSLSDKFIVECAADDMTGLLRAAQGQWSCVVLALNDASREPAAMIRQMRVLDRTRTTPILVHTELADARCVAALQAGANDMVFGNCSPAELSKRIQALALRKSVLDALRADAASIAPLSDFDHATGLPGPTQLMRSMPASLERLKAQGKPASLLLIAVDPLAGMPEGEAVPDSVMLALTQVLRRSLRGFDYACRYSADCFAILMPGADAKGAEAVANRICAEIKSEKVRLKDARKDGTTASIGLATMAASGGADTAQQMIATATDSLAKAQALGAAQVVAQELKLAA
jgi:two-component system, cell cycle response regulator